MTRYEQGFMNKCAEYGVDPEWLAERIELRQQMSKQALSINSVGSTLAPLTSKIKKFFTKSRIVPKTTRKIIGAGGGYSAPNVTEGLEEVTKISPDWARILAALGVTGGAAGLAAATGGSSGAADQVVSGISGGISPQAKAILAALGVTGAGIGGYAAIKAKRRKSLDKDKDKNK